METKEKDTDVGKGPAEKSVRKKEKCIHQGHRGRLLDLAFNAGLDNMSKFQVMECFLGYIFPRGDVNPLAHKLLDRFENFNSVIDADIVDLKSVYGINDRSAKMISVFEQFFSYYVEARMSKKFLVRTKSELMDVVEDLLRFRNTEHMLLLAISPANLITHKRRIGMNKQDKVSVDMLEIGKFLASTKTTGLVVAHCHPYGSAKPSPADVKTYQSIKDFCFRCGVRLVDSFIVGEDGVFGFDDNKMLRSFVDVAELKNLIDMSGPKNS